MFIYIIFLLFPDLSAITFNGEFVYCENFNKNMVLLDIRPMCSQAIFEEQKEILINSTNEETDFVLLRKIPKSKITKISVCTRVLSSLTSNWHLFKAIDYTYENKKLQVNEDECKDIRSGQCDIGNDPEKKLLYKMECIDSVCKTDLSPKKSYNFFNTYYDSVVNCFLEIFEIDETSNSKIGQNLRTNNKCISPISCDDTIYQCSCLSNDAHYHWSYKPEEKIFLNFEPIQIFKNIKVIENTLYSDMGIPIFTIVNKTNETLWTVTPETNLVQSTKNFDFEFGIRDNSELKRIKRQKGNAQRNKFTKNKTNGNNLWKNIYFELYYTKDMTLITNNEAVIDWAQQSQITISNMSSISKTLENDASFKFKENFIKMKTFFENGMQLFNKDQFHFIINNTKFLKEANDISFCFAWKTSVNIFSKFENEYNVLEDLTGGKYILFTKYKKIWVPKCSRINEIGFEKENLQAADHKCNKDLPVIFFRTDQFHKRRIAHKGFINELGIIHQNHQEISCEGLEQLFIFPIHLNNNHSFLTITRKAFELNFSIDSNYLFDKIDPFDFSRNHIKIKLENILQNKEEMSNPSSLIDLNQSKMFFSIYKLYETKNLRMDNLVIVPILTILTNFVLFCLFLCFKKIKNQLFINELFKSRYDLYNKT